MQPVSDNDKKRVMVAASLLGVIMGVVAALWLTGRAQTSLSALTHAFSCREALRDYVEAWGRWAPVVFVSLQALQVVVAPIPGEFTGAVGGFIFGALPNVAYSTAGLTLGSMLAFLAARIIGLPLVKLAVSPQLMERFHFLTERRGAALAFVLFVVPGFPKDILSYLMGLSPMGFLRFMAVCGLGRLPGTVMLSYGGSALYEENWPLLVALTAAAGAMAIMTYMFKDRINGWLDKSTPGS